MADINSLDDIFNSDEFGLLNIENEVKIHIILHIMNDLIINLEKNEYFRNELFNLLNSNNLNNIVIEIEKIIVLKPNNENKNESNNQNINTNENENI